MKILIAQTGNIMLQGLYDALIKTSEVHFFWNPAQSIYEILDRVKPDLFLCENNKLSSTVIKAIAEFNLSTIVYGMCNTFPQLKLQIISADIDKNLLKNIIGPYYVMNYAAHKNVKIEDYPASNILVINTLPKETIETLFQYVSNLKEPYKIVGETKINVPEYIGKVDLIEILSLAKSAKSVILTGPEYGYELIFNKIPFTCITPYEFKNCTTYSEIVIDILKEIKNA